jgi:hypothetical protein
MRNLREFHSNVLISEEIRNQKFLFPEHNCRIVAAMYEGESALLSAYTQGKSLSRVRSAGVGHSS